MSTQDQRSPAQHPNQIARFSEMRAAITTAIVFVVCLAGVLALTVKGRAVSEFLWGYEAKYQFFLYRAHLSDEAAAAWATVVWAAHVAAYAYLTWWVIFRLFVWRITPRTALRAFLALVVPVPWLFVQAWFRESPRPVTDAQELSTLKCFDDRTNVTLIWYHRGPAGSLEAFRDPGYADGDLLAPVTREVCAQIRLRAQSDIEAARKRSAELERERSASEERLQSERRRKEAEEQLHKKLDEVKEFAQFTLPSIQCQNAAKERMDETFLSIVPIAPSSNDHRQAVLDQAEYVLSEGVGVILNGATITADIENKKIKLYDGAYILNVRGAAGDVAFEPVVGPMTFRLTNGGMKNYRSYTIGIRFPKERTTSWLGASFNPIPAGKCHNFYVLVTLR